MNVEKIRIYVFMFYKYIYAISYDAKSKRSIVISNTNNIYL